MSVVNTERFKELMKFKKEFNAKLKESFDKYESKIAFRNKISQGLNKTKKTMDKSHSSIQIKNFPKSKFNKPKTLHQKMFSTTYQNFNYNFKKPKRINSYIQSSKNIWKTQHMGGDYLDKIFKRLSDLHDMSIWEKTRIGLAERSYAKEQTALTQHNLICRNLYSNDLNPYPNNEKSIAESILGLTTKGKKMIKKFIEQNKEKENILKENDNNVFKYMHSKPPLDLNKWKYGNHIIEYFSTPHLDKIYSFRVDTKPDPEYMTKPFRRPKDNGDYFDKHIGVLYN